jgi:GTP-binding protein
MKFLDQVKIYVKAGNGGDGSPSFRRENMLSMEVPMEAMAEKVDQ